MGAVGRPVHFSFSYAIEGPSDRNEFSFPSLQFENDG